MFSNQAIAEGETMDSLGGAGRRTIQPLDSTLNELTGKSKIRRKQGRFLAGQITRSVTLEANAKPSIQDRSGWSGDSLTNTKICF